MTTIFRNPPDVNYRAVRDMGLAAWWGSSLAALGTLQAGVGRVVDEPLLRHRVIDAGWRSTRGLTAVAVTSYFVGTSLVHFEGKPFEGGVPKWVTEGPESPLRSAVAGIALASAVTARNLRNKATEKFEEARRQGRTDEPEEVARLQRTGHMLHALVPACVGWLLYSHLKQDFLESSGRLEKVARKTWRR